MQVSTSTPAVIFRVALGCGIFWYKNVSLTVTLYASIPEVLGSNLAWDIGYPNLSVHVFPQSLQENIGIVSKLLITAAARSEA
jgi:hypothetical protein